MDSGVSSVLPIPQPQLPLLQPMGVTPIHGEPYPPTGKYRKCFLKCLPRETHYCRCGAFETRMHLLFHCPFLKQSHRPMEVLSKKGFLNFLKFNWTSFTFNHEGIGWGVWTSSPLLSKPWLHSLKLSDIAVELDFSTYMQGLGSGYMLTV